MTPPRASLGSTLGRSDLYEPTAAEWEQFRSLSAGFVLHARFAETALADDLVWILPWEVLPRVTSLYDVPVEHAEVAEPMLAHRVRRSMKMD